MTQEVLTETQRKADVGVPFEVALVANPSTGYGWQIDQGASLDLQNITIEDLGTGSAASKSDRPILGAPAMHTWRITPRQRGSVRLVLGL